MSSEAPGSPDVFVDVEVHEATETLHTSISREVCDDYYRLPEHLVVAYERARQALTAAETAIGTYIEQHGLKPRHVDHMGDG